MNKTISVVISGLPAGDNIRDVEIQSGNSFGDILDALGLRGYLLSREGSNQAFAAEENAFDTLTAGEKLRATPVAEVGQSNWWRSVLRLVRVTPPAHIVPRNDPPVRVIARPLLPPHSQRIRAERDRRTLVEIRGWRRCGDRFVGAYRTAKKSFAGEISVANPRRPEFYIVNPPQTILKNSKHGACFRKRNNGRYFIHFGIQHPDVDAGLVAVEKLLAQAV